MQHRASAVNDVDQVLLMQFLKPLAYLLHYMCTTLLAVCCNVQGYAEVNGGIFIHSFHGRPVHRRVDSLSSRQWNVEFGGHKY